MKLKTFILDNDRATDRGRHTHGEANGYVVINKDHPYYGKEAWQIERYLDVHGGVTFSDTLKQCKEKFSRIYEEYLKLEGTSEDDEVTIIGFDTLHYGDTKEEWNKEAVKKEAEILAEQLEKLRQSSKSGASKRRSLLFYKSFGFVKRLRQSSKSGASKLYLDLKLYEVYIF